jgi:hypothetical protein
MKKDLFKLSAVILILVTTCSFGQEDNKAKSYLTINDASPAVVHRVSSNELNLEYHDTYGSKPELPLIIKDWKGQTVAAMNLVKSFGLNHFEIDLNTQYSGWEIEKTYIAETRNEGGKVFQLAFYLAEIISGEVTANIVVNPLEYSCNRLKQSVVEFYGDINGGQAPYTVQWYVLSKDRTEFINQPKKEIITDNDKSTLITVDQKPEYNVVLYVKDACGKEDKKIVNLSCPSKKKKINTFFVEEMIAPKNVSK